MTSKAIAGSIIFLLVVIAGYLGYLAWDRHQHNQQEAQQQQQDLKFDAAFLGTTPEKLAAARKAKGINAASEEAEARAAVLK